MKKITVTSIIAMVLLGGLFGGWAWYTYNTFLGPDSALMGNSTYVAVFLTTNQVFFGKIESMNYRDVVLTDTFYLQQGGTTANPEFILQKSGSELHAPEDTMFINRDHILIIQPLKPSSQVITSIKQYKESLTKSATQETAGKKAAAPEPAVPASQDDTTAEPQVLE
ncbi:hypothetical protein IPJ70_03885 [Candidatus Campbellbacteria bacterium]|nr:MAG: hypothetical protein IPJ70_03885 [Candidatus Campbellbacteria bacterium]